MLEKSDMIWKSYMFILKKGTLKFLFNSCLDTLPTQTNLLQRGKSASDLCKLCLQAGTELQGRRQETTNHILNGCKIALHQKRYTWRHNNLIKYKTGLIDIDRFLMYADIPLETNIKNANAQKMSKYEHFNTDITTRDVSVYPFEISSRGYISPSNQTNPVLVSKQCVKIYQALLYCHHTTFLENEKH